MAEWNLGPTCIPINAKMKTSRLNSTAKDLMSDDALEMVLRSEWKDFQFFTILSSRTRRKDRTTDMTDLPCPPPAEIRARRSSMADDMAITPSNAVEPLLVPTNKQ